MLKTSTLSRIAASALIASVAFAPGAFAANKPAPKPVAKTTAKPVAKPVAAPSGPCAIVTPAPTMQTIKIAGTQINTTAAVLAADKANCFAKYGIKLAWTDAFPAPGVALTALAGGSIEVTYAPTVPIINFVVNAGLKAKILAPGDGYAPGQQAKILDSGTSKMNDDTAVLVKTGGSIKSWADLEGKTVAVPARKAQLEVTIAAKVREDGGDPSKVKFLALGMPDMAAAIKKGDIDAGGVVEPFGTSGLADGLTLLGFPAAGFFNDGGAVGVWLATDAWASAHRDLALAFQKAMSESNAWAAAPANLSKVRAEIPKITGVTAAEAAASNIPFLPTSAVTASDVSSVATKMNFLGYISKKVDAASLLFK